MSEKKSSAITTTISIALLGGAAWFLFGGGLEKKAANDMAKLEQQVASDFTQQYEIAKRNGSPADICIQAGIVAASYLQAKDEPNYQTWKATQKSDCAKAGLPNM